MTAGSPSGSIDQIRDILRLAHRNRTSIEGIRSREARSGLRRRAGSRAVAETVGGVPALRIPGAGTGWFPNTRYRRRSRT